MKGGRAYRIGMSEETARLVHQVLTGTGWTQTKLGDKVDVDQSTISRWLKGAEPQPPGWPKFLSLAKKLADTRGLSLVFPGDLYANEQEIALQGEIGAGALIYDFGHDTVTKDLEYIRVPKSWGDVVAVRVRGDSMWPVYRNRDILCFTEFCGDLGDLIGRECLIRTDDGKRLVKTIEDGSRPGVYNLTAYNAPTIRDQTILEARPFRYLQRD